MREIILEKLKDIESSENIRILLAVESGSRAWGFASPDSDYDVRFIYARATEDYLKLEGVRDVIEEPINEVLDISGWDIKKTLQLLYRSNPTIFEWMSSPIVYLDNGLRDRIKPLLSEYFYPQKSIYHYLSMAKNNDREFLKWDVVKAKKYFYVLRPILACKWILSRNLPPPMRFSELLDAELDSEIKPEVDSLLDLKLNAPERKLIPRVEPLNEYLHDSMQRIELQVKKLHDKPQSTWDKLSRLFLECIGYRPASERQ